MTVGPRLRAGRVRGLAALQLREAQSSCHDVVVTGTTSSLRVPPRADAATVRAAFGRQVRAVHPDIVGPGDATAGAKVAALVAERDRLLGKANPPPAEPRARVVFFQHQGLLGVLQSWRGRRRQPRRYLH
jgi:hypothetical protein